MVGVGSLRQFPVQQRREHQEMGRGSVRAVGGENRVPLLREPRFLAQRKPIAGRWAAYPPYSRDDRAGTLRCVLPRDQILGFTPGVDAGGIAPRTELPAFVIQGRQYAR